MRGEDIQETLEGSPYSVNTAAAEAMAIAITELEERITLLRSGGTLTPATLQRYYGAKRFDQVAESNAIEGSTLTVGETELAIVKGVTLTGHDPGYVRDAIALDRALARLAEMAKDGMPTDIAQVKELHELILEGRPSAGSFRNEPVRISGSRHRPPKTWHAIMSAMEEWARWSSSRTMAAPILRATVLHAWFVHIHPFLDGNGRCARAISNLELIRAGYPSIIIRKVQDRDRYINALQESDKGGNIGPLFELVYERAHGALVGLEQSAHEKEGYDPVIEKLRQAQSRQLQVWNTAVELLYRVVVERLSAILEGLDGQLDSLVYSQSVSLDDYLELCAGRPVSKSWAFTLRGTVPGLPVVERLAWVGFRSQALRNSTGHSTEYAPSILWSKPNPGEYPPWILANGEDAPSVVEFSVERGVGDIWHVLTTTNEYRRVTTSELARMIASGFGNLIST